MSEPTDNYLRMMSAWLDASKSCAQLATASLFLPIFYSRQFIGNKADSALSVSLSPWHLACWVSLAVCIGVALLYQLTVARLIQSKLTDTSSGLVFPRVQFWIMVASLLLGIAFFVRGAM